jgi:hypothetical protein
MYLLARNQTRYFQSVSVRKDVNWAIDVRTQCENASLPQTFKKLRTWMVIGIFFACRDDGETRPNGRGKISSRGTFAAMMSDF